MERPFTFGKTGRLSRRSRESIARGDCHGGVTVPKRPDDERSAHDITSGILAKDAVDMTIVWGYLLFVQQGIVRLPKQVQGDLRTNSQRALVEPTMRNGRRDGQLL